MDITHEWLSYMTVTMQYRSINTNPIFLEDYQRYHQPDSSVSSSPLCFVHLRSTLPQFQSLLISRRKPPKSGRHLPPTRWWRGSCAAAPRRLYSGRPGSGPAAAHPITRITSTAVIDGARQRRQPRRKSHAAARSRPATSAMSLRRRMRKHPHGWRGEGSDVSIH